MRRKAPGVAVAGLAAVFVISTAVVAAKVDTWKHEGASAFSKAKRERVVISDSGKIRLARQLSTAGSLTAARVWDLARTPRGTVYAATGDEGKVFRRERADGSWKLTYDAADSQALSLAALDDGRVYVGTGPGGQVVEIAGDKPSASRPDPSVLYIWDLASDARGNLYAATGPNGQLWKRSSQGEWSLLFKSKHKHLLCLAIARDGSVYTGSDGDGLIYRITADGKASVVYDAPQSEIRALSIGPDGAIYAGTAAESGGGSGTGRGSFLSSSDSDGSSILGGSGRGLSATPLPAQSKESPPAPKAKDASKSAGTAAPKPVSSGDNAVYRIGSDGVPREIFRAKVLIHALAWQEDRLLVGTGPDGQLYEVVQAHQGYEVAPLAKLDHGQILSLLADSPRSLLIGTGDPGSVAQLDSAFVPVGTLTSDVFDTKLLSRFGAITWKGERPKGTTLAVQVRSGNVGEPDETWSAWSAEQTDPTAARAIAPLGRFLQYRLVLRTDDPTASPELSSLAIRYQTANLPPEITKLDIPDVGGMDGATRQSKLTIRWDASDPNGDELSYTLHVRKEGWPDWLELTEKSLTETRHDWDVTTLPAGTYRIKLVASDRLSNAPSDVLTSDRVSEPFLIDHEPPVVTLDRKLNRITVLASDSLTRLTRAAYALDAGEWKPVFPDDSLFDTMKETISIDLPDLKPGTHVILVRVTDAAGNVGTGDLVFEVR